MLYENLANEFATLIGNGQIRPGDRLPSVRHLARQRALSISTVVQALRTLESRGMVEARPQSGYYVRRRPARMVESALAGAPRRRRWTSASAAAWCRCCAPTRRRAWCAWARPCRRRNCCWRRA
jgi:DNA-binding transcriptional MocR family regulator